MSDSDPAPNPVQPTPEPLGGGAGDADRHEPTADRSNDPDRAVEEDLAARLDPTTKLGQVKG